MMATQGLGSVRLVLRTRSTLSGGRRIGFLLDILNEFSCYFFPRGRCYGGGNGIAGCGLLALKFRGRRRRRVLRCWVEQKDCRSRAGHLRDLSLAVKFLAGLGFGALVSLGRAQWILLRGDWLRVGDVNNELVTPVAARRTLQHDFRDFFGQRVAHATSRPRNTFSGLCHC